MSYLYLTVAIICEVIGTAGLKASENFTKLFPTLLVVTGYGLAFFFLSFALRTIPVGIAYAIWSGCGIALIAAVGYVWFGQALDTPALVGLGLILAGVIIVNAFSKSVAH